MKNSFLLIFIIMIIYSPSNAQWELLNQGSNIWSIDFANSTTGCIAGSDGILKTTDGGNSWTTTTTNKQWYVSKIKFFNSSIGWGIGSRDTFGIVIKTVDGGNNWFLQKEFSGAWFNGISIINNNNLSVVSSNKILKSSDGGSSWTEITPKKTTGFKSYSSVCFFDSLNGIAAGYFYDDVSQKGLICKTTDGGNTWDEKFVKEFFGFYEMQFVNDSTAFFKAYGDTSIYLCETEDRFSTWTTKQKARYWIGPFQFLNSSTGYAVVSDTILKYNIVKTSDGGNNWNILPNPKINQRLAFQNIYFNNDDNGFIIGSYGCIFKTSNGGLKWDLIRNGYPFFGSVFSDKSNGLIVGGYYAGIHEMYPSGDIFLTQDGGNSFNVVFNAPDFFKACLAINDSVIIVSGKSIYKTIDRGKNWNMKFTISPDQGGRPSLMGDLNSLNSLSFSENAIWAAGRDWDSASNTAKAIIYKSTDEGETWKLDWQILETTGTWYNLISIYMEENRGWAVGANGLIVKYTALSGWQTLPSETDLPLKKVFSIDNNIWISGGYSYEKPVFLKSIDNGYTWIKNENLEYLINDFVFFNKNRGWAVGHNNNYRGVVLKTTDGGNSWEPVINDLPGILNSLYVKDNYSWAVGDNGLLLRTTNSGLTWIDDKNNVYPTEYKLEQNYPNPFNPVTKISWQMPSAGKVTIKIYNQLGKEVATLVNEEFSAGLHNVEFNAKNLSSGVYFYKLETGLYSESRKMLLLK